MKYFNTQRKFLEIGLNLTEASEADNDARLNMYKNRQEHGFHPPL